MSRTIVFWGTGDEEQLTHTDQDDAIEGILDMGELSGTLEICGYARMELPGAESLCDHVLEHILEGLDEEHSDPEGSYSEPTDNMKEAAKVFVTAVLSEYTSWACEIVERKTIDVAAWVKENRPDWLEEKMVT